MQHGSTRAASLMTFGALLGLSMVGLQGCKKPEYPACKRDKHCNKDAGEKCVDGTCQNCTTDQECLAKGPNGEDWVCHEFRCQDPTTIEGAQPGGLGSPCTQTTDCSGGLVCKAGKCANCSEDMECAPGTCDLATGLCTTGGDGTCQVDDDCAMDEICDNGSCVFSGVQGGENPCNLEAVYFEFDSPKLKPEVVQQLEGVAECFKQQGRKVFLEAHADPRGTEEYNIMLTDRRGQSVREFLVNLGVDGEMMQVISKGNLEASGTDEASWAKDRRVEFVWP